EAPRGADLACQDDARIRPRKLGVQRPQDVGQVRGRGHRDLLGRRGARGRGQEGDPEKKPWRRAHAPAKTPKRYILSNITLPAPGLAGRPPDIPSAEAGAAPASPPSWRRGRPAPCLRSARAPPCRTASARPLPR